MQYIGYNNADGNKSNWRRKRTNRNFAQKIIRARLVLAVAFGCCHWRRRRCLCCKYNAGKSSPKNSAGTKQFDNADNTIEIATEDAADVVIVDDENDTAVQFRGYHSGDWIT